MPLYEFSCKKCGHAFEELLMASELGTTAKLKCPACGSARTERGISSFASQSGGFSSSGFSGGGCGSGGFT